MCNTKKEEKYISGCRVEEDTATRMKQSENKN